MKRTYTTTTPGQTRPTVLSDLLAMAGRSHNLSVSKAIEMMDDLRAHGLSSRFVKHLENNVYELKTRTKDGGVRVYFFRCGADAYALVRAEVKREDHATQALVAATQAAHDAWAASKAVLS